MTKQKLIWRAVAALCVSLAAWHLPASSESNQATDKLNGQARDAAAYTLLANSWALDDGDIPWNPTERYASELNIDREQTVHFGVNSAFLTERVQDFLRNLAHTYHDLGREITRIRLEGHTDSGGTSEQNRQLAQRRAEAVQRFLQEQGIEAQEWEIIATGERSPLASNETEIGRQENRRVVISIATADE